MYTLRLIRLSWGILGHSPRLSCGHLGAHTVWLESIDGRAAYVNDTRRLEAFALESHSWDPKGKARAIHLKQNSVLSMPPGLPLVHSVLTLDTCLQESGMLWDELALLSALETILWIAIHRLAMNEAYPHQLRDAIYLKCSCLETCPDSLMTHP